MSLTNAPGRDAYAISAFTYLLVHKDQQEEAKGKALVSFLKWATHEGQKQAPDLLYAPLPESVLEKAEALINTITSADSLFKPKHN